MSVDRLLSLGEERLKNLTKEELVAELSPIQLLVYDVFRHTAERYHAGGFHPFILANLLKAIPEGQMRLPVLKVASEVAITTSFLMRDPGQALRLAKTPNEFWRRVQTNFLENWVLNLRDTRGLVLRPFLFGEWSGDQNLTKFRLTRIQDREGAVDDYLAEWLDFSDGERADQIKWAWGWLTNYGVIKVGADEGEQSVHYRLDPVFCEAFSGGFDQSLRQGLAKEHRSYIEKFFNCTPRRSKTD